MCIHQKEIEAAWKIINKQSKDLTPEEYEILKDVQYPIKQLGYAIKEKASS